jgi:hypothetical protein
MMRLKVYRGCAMSGMLLTDLALASDPELPEFFLGRLASLVARQAATASPREREALGMAIFAAVLDCTDLGLGAEAQEIVAQLHAEPGAGERLVA